MLLLVLLLLVPIILGSVLMLQRQMQCSNHSDLCFFLFGNYSDPQNNFNIKLLFFFSSVNSLYEKKCVYIQLCALFMIFTFQSSVFIFIIFLKIHEICKGTKKDTCQKLAFNTLLAGANFLAIIQAAGQVSRVQTGFFCATCTESAMEEEKSANC